MRVIVAGLFVFTSLLVLVGFLGSQETFDRAPSWVVGSGVVLFMFTVIALSLWLFNPKGSDPFGRLREALGPSEEPAVRIMDDVLGAMQWNEDNEAWLGEHNSFRFSLAYLRKREPTQTLLDYARATLTDPHWLHKGLTEAKAAALKRFGDHYVEEVNSLRFGLIHFNEHKGAPNIFAELEGGRDHRCWRIEYSGTRCEGMGFDN